MDERKDSNGHYIPVENPLNWHPDLTSEQIMHMIGEKGIPIPVKRYGGGTEDEYNQALMEYGIIPGEPHHHPTPPSSGPQGPGIEEQSGYVPKDPRELREPQGSNFRGPHNPGYIGSQGPGSDETDVFGFGGLDNSEFSGHDKVEQNFENDEPSKKVPTSEELIDATLKELGNSEKNVIVKIRKKFRSFAPVLLSVGMAALVLSGFKIEDKIVTQNIAIESVQENLEYEIS